MTALLVVAVLALAVVPVLLLVRDVRTRARTPRRPGGLDDALDLHGFPPGEIPAAVRAYLEAAIDEGLREVRLIHGKGRGVQRQRVQSLLAEHPDVESYFDAPPQRGSWGATIARLRRRDVPA